MDIKYGLISKRLSQRTQQNSRCIKLGNDEKFEKIRLFDKGFFTGVEKISQKKDFYLKSHKVCVWLSDQLTKTRSSHWRCSIKKVLLKISQNPQENTCVRVSFLIKLQVTGLQLY